MPDRQRERPSWHVLVRWRLHYDGPPAGFPVASVPVSERVLGWLAVATVISTLCCRLGYLPLLSPDEGRNAEIAREMKESGAWLVPTYDGAARLDKPAFFFKAVALSLAVFGNTEAAARLPSAAAGVGLTLLVFAFCRRVHGTRCGLLAVIVIATTPLFVANARTVVLDMMLALFVCGAIFAGYLAELKEGPARRNWYLAGAALGGLATLVKGPVGFLIPALVLLVFNRLEGRVGAWRRLLSPWNILVVLGVALPWFIALCVRHPDFLQYGLVEESFKRFTSSKRFGRSEPFYFYVPIVAVMFLPWSLLLPEAIWMTWKERWPKHSADRLCLVWAVVVVVFFSISQSKLPGYILSVTVAGGILVARVLESALTTPEGRAGGLVRRATAALAGLCLVVAAVAALAGVPHMQALAKPLRISVDEAGGLYRAAVPVMVGLGCFAGLGVFAFRRRGVPLCFLCLALFPQVFGHTSFGVFSGIFEARSARRLADKCAALPATTELACLECFPNGLSFYLGRTLTVFSRNCRELSSNYIVYSIGKSGKWPEKVIPLSELDGWLKSREGPVCLIAPSGRRERLAAIAEAGGAKVEALSAAYLAVKLGPRQSH
jgi:4-amino-4-deoxy-L-arabinose transferase-like glycosyltransferase